MTIHLDEDEFEQLVWERYDRLLREAFNPYWQRHCRRLDSGWTYNDIFKKFWLPPCEDYLHKDTRKKDYSVSKWFGTRSARFVEFYIGKLSKAGDPIDDAEELAETRAAAAQPEWEQQQFTQIDGEDDELPF